MYQDLMYNRVSSKVRGTTLSSVKSLFVLLSAIFTEEGQYVDFSNTYITIIAIFHRENYISGLPL